MPHLLNLQIYVSFIFFFKTRGVDLAIHPLSRLKCSNEQDRDWLSWMWNGWIRIDP